MMQKFTVLFKSVLVIFLFAILPYSSAIAQADAGVDQEVCIDNTSLAANSGQTGVWSIVSGTGNIGHL